MADRRDRLVRRMKACGYSQERLAHALPVDRTTVGRWVRGEAAPQGFLWPKLARLLKVNPAELERLLEPDEPPAPATRSEGGDFDDVIRRDFLQLVTTAGALASTPVPAAAGATEYASMGPHLWQVYSLASSKQSVYPLVRDQAIALSHALRASHGEGHKRLCADVGDLFQLAGEIMFDGNRYTDAAHCYTLAASAAREAGNPDLWACALTRHAFIGLYGDQRYEETAPLVELARHVARRGDTQLSTRHWVSAVQAEIFAAIGDLDSCKRALDEAEEVHSLAGPVHNGGWLRFDGSRLAEERGTCFTKLQRPDLAEDALGAALRQLPPASRRRGAILADLALIGVQRRDVDQLMSYANEALNVARQRGSGWVGRKLLVLREELEPLKSDRRVRELSEQISALKVSG
ncbi:helix-turn-helix domain-containing protein [Streptomyces sp. KLOTTS4A1]|uniref:helix-turn-helix domain-containing protein n=1 Tax=Streptomyces sp. KLOTTS4A1 TaxID=3390996 RepID=UPI0039F4AC92